MPSKLMRKVCSSCSGVIPEKTSRHVLLCSLVHKDVEPAEHVDGPLDGLVAECRLANIALDQQKSAALLFNERLRTASIVGLLQIDDRHVSAFLGEVHSHGLVDARNHRR